MLRFFSHRWIWFNRNNFEKDNETKSDEVENEQDAAETASLETTTDSKEDSKTKEIGVGDGVVDSQRVTKKGHSLYGRIFCDKPEPAEPLPELDLFDTIVKNLHREMIWVTIEAVAGSFASICSTFCSHPFEVIKSHYQLLRFPKTVYLPFYRRRKFIDVIRNIYMTKGLKRFYRGHMVAQGEWLFQTIAMFWTYQHFQSHLEQTQLGDYPDVCTFVSGFLSATINVMALKPLIVWREKQRSRRILVEKYGTNCAPFIYRMRFDKRLMFRGCFSLFLYSGTQFGLRFLFFQKIQEEMMQRKQTNDKTTNIHDFDAIPDAPEVQTIMNLTPFQLLTAGALSAIFSDILVHPLGTIHSRLSMRTLMRQHYRYEDTCRRFFQCIGLILKKESIKAFYAGITPCVVQSAVNTAVQFVIYAYIREWLLPIIGIKSPSEVWK